MKIRAVALIGAALGAIAHLRGPDLDQRVIHREVFVAHKAPGLLVHFGKELLRHIGSQQPVAVLREHRMVSHRVVHT